MVSVIVAMRDAQDYIVKSLEAILAEVQTPIQVIVVNDGSQDRSLDLVTSFQDPRIFLTAGPNRGISACLNAGLARARGSIIMRCDADDVFPPGRIREQVKWLDDHPEFDAVCGGFSTIDAAGRPIVEMPCGDYAMEITDELMAGSTRTHLCTYAMRASLVKKVGGFRDYFQTAEDIDFQLMLSSYGRIAYVPQQWYFYRIHSSSVTHTQKSDRRTFFEKTAIEFQHQRQLYGSDDLQRDVAAPPPAPASSEIFTAGEHIQGMLLGKAWIAHNKGDRIEALTAGIRALRINPVSLTTWKSVVALFLKPTPQSSPNGGLDG